MQYQQTKTKGKTNMRHIARTLQTHARQLMFVVVALIAAVGLIVSPHKSDTAFAACGSGCVASLRVTPGSGSYNPGNTLTVSVYVNSGGQNVNAVQADFTYSTSLLQFQSINSAGSSFGIDASSTGGGGSVSIARGNISAISGSSLLVAQVSFQVLSAGTASIGFSGSSTVASSSTNQDILGSTSGGSYAISNPTPPPSTPPASNPTTPPTVNTPTPTASPTKKPAPVASQPSSSTPQTPTETPTNEAPTTTSVDQPTDTTKTTDTQQSAKKQGIPWATIGLVTGGVAVLGAAGAGAWLYMRHRSVMPVKSGTVPTSTFITGPATHVDMPPVNPDENLSADHHDDTQRPV